MSKILSHFAQELDSLKSQGLFKKERVISSAQQAEIEVNQKTVLNLCANNYLGLANHPEILEAATDALKTHGFGMASVRFICGTQDLHKTLEQRLASFLEKEDCILYSSAFDANGGLFETILSEEDVIISDALNHASIIDGIRLSKAQRYRYAHSNLEELESHLQNTQNQRFRLIATDGIFSMDGDVAKLKEITTLARKYDALVMVDDCHATGFLGKKGKGSAEFCGVLDQV